MGQLLVLHGQGVVFTTGWLGLWLCSSAAVGHGEGSD
jgi:hypothetical protein